MATLYITEYSALGFAGLQAPYGPPTAVQTVAIGGGSTQSAAFNGDTRLIEVTCDAICSVRVGGTSPVATTSDSRFFASRVSYYVVNPGDKLAVISNV